ncbi:MAG: NADP-dependent malic enzyme [Alphaproteobacteria bacterium]|nr:NADP-dependent malic enzyme [Alphaproteobacteria bacterium]
MADDLRNAALDYHRAGRPGKIEVAPTKPLATQRDLALAYSPGVAAACEAIVEDPQAAAEVTARGNLVAVVTNGSAVLGLGAIGPLASKPVMEGKGVLFKKFAGIDVFDIEIDADDPEKLVDIVAALEPTFGAINLEDIKAPDCFVVEDKLRARMNIPVLHDDQHGTAIIVAAAMLNGLRVVAKPLDSVRLVASGAGAAALACLNLLVKLGLPKENITVTDIAGVVYQGRTEQMDEWKAAYAIETEARTLADVIAGADVFLGLSAPNVLKPEMVKQMADRPVILALANPVPEIMPDVAREARPDAVIATGRSDFPNQVNNVLCFPFIFRGALDVGATTINDEMKMACVHALTQLAMAEGSEIVARAYGGNVPRFGPDYLIPRPFDPRLISTVAPAVAKAAMDSGVATRPLEDLEAYRSSLERYVYRSGLVMKPVFDQARTAPKRLVYAEGEDDRVLRAVQIITDEGFAKPILIGRPRVVESRIERLGLRVRPGEHFELVNPEDDPRFDEYWKLYHSLMERRGVTPTTARKIVRTRNTVIAALMLKRGETDAMIAGPSGPYQEKLEHVMDIIGLAPGVRDASALNGLITRGGIVFLCDTYVTIDPDAHELAEMAVMAAEEVQRFGIEPKVALLSHSTFGTQDDAWANKVREALRLLRERAPGLEAEGEIQADAAMDEELRMRLFPNSRLKGAANLLVMPNIDAANISFNLLKTVGEGLSIGPMLLGVAQPAHVLTPSVTARGVLNMSALAVVDAQKRSGSLL